MTIKAVLFDLDDTLLWDDKSVEEAFQATCREAQKMAGIDPFELEQAVRRGAIALYETYDVFPFAKMIGINAFEALWGHFTEGADENFRKLERLAPVYRKEAWTRGLKAVGVDDPELGYSLGEIFPAERRKRPLVYDETFPVLNRLKDEGYQLLMLTNGAPDLQQEKINGVPELAPYFEHIVISGNFGEGKPAASIFEYAVRLLGIRPEEGIMVGDKLNTDILGSSRIGMPNAWVNRRGSENRTEIRPVHEIRNLQSLFDILEHSR
ncbi:HAD family hydrolase [Ferviditalea candida]|uniref:Phosphoserine phosphatase n=1 Tax=Ferviditalea candida TaxID=3108399 RepID=A0ABU5ZJP9_9BACL|nr:HAD-IA family hydrolase [Paenibacillaceae bacterium T2]